MFTWHGGNRTAGYDPGFFVGRGITSPLNYPAARLNIGAGALISDRNSFMIFGGSLRSPQNTGYYSTDLWEFSITTRQWTYHGGSITTTDQGILTTEKNEFSAQNWPSARDNAAMAYVPSMNALFLFGGNGLGTNNGGGGRLNDLWLYNLTLGQWAFVSGSYNTYSSGSYSTLYSYSPSNMPAARAYPRMVYAENDHSLLVYGGDFNSEFDVPFGIPAFNCLCRPTAG